MKGLALALGLAAAAASAPSMANAEIFIFRADLLGTNEAPPNASPGVGIATLVWDDVAHTVLVEAEFSGLVAGVTAAHVHAPLPTTMAGSPTFPVATRVPTFLNFPSGVTSGTYSMSFATNSAAFYNGGATAYLNAWGGVAGAEAAFLTALQNGNNYFNIHSSTFPGGEIRGTLVQVVPEPSVWALMIAGFGATGAMLRRRRLHVLA